MSLSEFVTKYWSQIFALGALVVGAFKFWLDYRNKRLEIKASLYFKERLNYVLTFYDRYFDAESILSDYIERASYKYQQANDLDANVYTKVQALRSAFRYIELLLPEGEVKPFRAIMDNINMANRFLGDFNHRGDRHEIKSSNEAHRAINKYLRTNEQYFKIISANTKVFFSNH